MTGVLVAGAARAVRRSWLLWAVSLAALIGLTTAFWPAFRDNPESGAAVAGMPEGLVEALGIEDLSSPEGFLWGNLYALIVPLLMACAGSSILTTLTARQEDSGHYELILTQPLSRTAALLARIGTATAAMVTLGLAVLIIQLASNSIWELDITTSRLAATVTLCTLTALVSVGACAITAGLTPRPGAAMAAGVGIAVAGYVLSALFPLREGWENAKYLAPWNWALGGNPLTTDTDPWRYLAPLALTLALTTAALIAFNRRDVHAP
ncbi:MAG TPA: ABC transporter permease subunit [Actinophytocola sp.]|uniref:ABC transporter permease subunit n=1 Tax=Actinophytocola sp. TaxID=1872138 RepID=UPI002DBC0052|nr:ABC transporter permease subunit [Actinophytocola sp.]HEU5472297.1 ABC transporter permease subunit [Actinophytocola sp.]